MWSREGEKEGVGWVGRAREAGRGSSRALQRALLARGESFPEEVFTGGFAVPLGKR